MPGARTVSRWIDARDLAGRHAVQSGRRCSESCFRSPSATTRQAMAAYLSAVASAPRRVDALSVHSTRL